jgi:ArsR family transcriptional regulator
MSVEIDDHRYDDRRYDTHESMDVNMLIEETPALCCAPLLGAPLSADDANELALVLKALADPVRLRLVSLIAATPGGEACACDLPERVERSQPTVSHHLSQLVAAGVLEREQRGKWAWFRVREEQLAAVTAALTASR